MLIFFLITFGSIYLIQLCASLIDLDDGYWENRKEFLISLIPIYPLLKWVYKKYKELPK